MEDVSIAARVEVIKGLGMAVLLSNPGFFLVSECLFLIVSRYFMKTQESSDFQVIYEHYKRRRQLRDR